MPTRITFFNSVIYDRLHYLITVPDVVWQSANATQIIFSDADDRDSSGACVNVTI